MNSEDKFWLGFWSLLVTVILALILSNAIDNAGQDTTERLAIEKGLQPYKVTKCERVITFTEWHEANWTNPNKGITIWPTE